MIFKIKTLIRHICQYNYPKEVKTLLDRQYEKIYKHNKKIKNIRKFQKKYDPYIYEKKYVKAIKNHKHMINKANKEIDFIKKYYLDK